MQVVVYNAGIKHLYTNIKTLLNANSDPLSIFQQIWWQVYNFSAVARLTLLSVTVGVTGLYSIGEQRVVIEREKGREGYSSCISGGVT